MEDHAGAGGVIGSEVSATSPREPLCGEEVQKMIAAFVATPKEWVDQAKRYVGQ